MKYCVNNYVIPNVYQSYAKVLWLKSVIYVPSTFENLMEIAPSSIAIER